MYTSVIGHHYWHWCCTAQWHHVKLCYHCGDRCNNVSGVRLVHPVIHCRHHSMIYSQTQTGFVRPWCELLFPFVTIYNNALKFSLSEVVFGVVIQFAFCKVPYLDHKKPISADTSPGRVKPQLAVLSHIFN